MTQPIFREVYAAYSGGDDRGQGQTLVGYHSDEPQAEESIKGKGYFGGDGSVRKKTAIVVEGKCYILESITPIDLDQEDSRHQAEIRSKALAKLSPVERDALGLP
jgi:hypothetical protein